MTRASLYLAPLVLNVKDPMRVLSTQVLGKLTRLPLASTFTNEKCQVLVSCYPYKLSFCRKRTTNVSTQDMGVWVTLLCMCQRQPCGGLTPLIPRPLPPLPPASTLQVVKAEVTSRATRGGPESLPWPRTCGRKPLRETARGDKAFTGETFSRFTHFRPLWSPCVGCRHDSRKCSSLLVT